MGTYTKKKKAYCKPQMEMLPICIETILVSSYGEGNAGTGNTAEVQGDAKEWAGFEEWDDMDDNTDDLKHFEDLFSPLF